MNYTEALFYIQLTLLKIVINIVLLILSYIRNVLFKK